MGNLVSIYNNTVKLVEDIEHENFKTDFKRKDSKLGLRLSSVETRMSYSYQVKSVCQYVLEGGERVIIMFKALFSSAKHREIELRLIKMFVLMIKFRVTS